MTLGGTFRIIFIFGLLFLIFLHLPALDEFFGLSISSVSVSLSFSVLQGIIQVVLLSLDQSYAKQTSIMIFQSKRGAEGKSTGITFCGL